MNYQTTRSTLRRWAAGKHITKAQLQDLKDPGLITPLEDGQHRLTVHGTRLITGKDPK